MRSQALAVSLVLLLIAVATLPGISFSLSSSVTSYNNQVTVIGESDIGLYKDAGCTNPWDPNEAFSDATLHILGDNPNYTTRGDYREMSKQSGVFLMVNGSGSCNLTIKMSYFPGYTENQILSKVSIHLAEVNGTTVIKKDEISWDSIVNGIDFDIKRGYAYKLSIDVASDDAKTIVIDKLDPTDSRPLVNPIEVDIQFQTQDSILISHSKVGFGYESSNYNGITIDSSDNDHRFIECSDEKGELKGAVKISSKGDEDSFVGSATGNKSKVTLSNTGTHGYKLYFEIISNSNSGFRVLIGDEATGDYYPSKNKEYTESGFFGVTKEKTSSYNRDYSFSNNSSGVDFITESITLTVIGMENGKAKINLYIIFDDGKGTSNSASYSVEMASRIEDITTGQ